jgi:hypothetical protein
MFTQSMMTVISTTKHLLHELCVERMRLLTRKS